MSAASKTLTAVVSASMAVIAAQAMAEVARELPFPVVVNAPEVDGELKARIEAAVEKRDARRAISDAFAGIATGFGRDDRTLAETYFPGKDMVAVAEGDGDFTDGPISDYQPQCHGACHGFPTDPPPNNN